ncbi:MAG: hypothetical protein EPO40_19435 [Myxococcaceae bacterium]|nr:MAG: hypothetical protein EPO40_19435 [Myxococcaceae bacterium]
MHTPSPNALHPVTGLALVQPRGVLVTDHDLVRLATAERMFHGHAERELLERVGIEMERMDATG